MRPADARAFAPELCSLNMGQHELRDFPMISAIARFQHDWEREYL